MINAHVYIVLSFFGVCSTRKNEAVTIASCFCLGVWMPFGLFYFIKLAWLKKSQSSCLLQTDRDKMFVPIEKYVGT